MKKAFGGLAGIILGSSLLLAPGCSRAPSPEEGGGAYREALERARNRKAYDQSLDVVKKAVEKFQIELGRLPVDLNELVRYRYIDEFPAAVPAGYTYGYDAIRGYVTFVKIPVNELNE